MSTSRIVSQFDMLRLNGPTYTHAVARLVESRDMVLSQKAETRAGVFSDIHRSNSLELLNNLRPELEALEADSALDILDTLVDRIEAGTLTYATYAECVHQMLGRLFGQLKRRHLYVLRLGQSAYFENAQLFGGEVSYAFPCLDYDIREAAKCFALERWTASAFHSIRCLEGGIGAVSRCLGIPDPIKGSDRNWSQIQRLISAKLEEKWPDASAKMSADYKHFEKLRGALAAFQNPYRNECMHLEGKYDEEEARHIIEMVRGIMQQIAARCDENGNPKA